MPSSPPRRFFGGLPLVPIAPAIVVVVGVATAVVIALLGITQMQRTSDEASILRARVLSATLAARLRSTAIEDRADVLSRAARRSSAELLLVEQNGRVVLNESFGAPKADDVVRMLVRGSGEVTTSTGRLEFAAHTLGPRLANLSVVALVAAPSPPQGSTRFVTAVAALTVLMLGVAVAVALAFTKTARDDVDYVRRRIEEMARTEGEAVGKSIPVRSLDQVGVLTASFNLLMTRFAAAERSYRADLAQAAAIDRERSAFLAGLSHELRTPLNAILGFAHLLESGVDGPLSSDAAETLGVIRTSGEHLRTLIGDILDLSAIDSGDLQLARGVVDVRVLAEHVLREAAATLGQKPIELLVTGASGLRAHADKRRVRQVLTNLVHNAVRFTPRGTVTVHVEARPPFVAVVVSDTGTGIQADEMELIFQEYRQSGDARSRRGGTGLGLAITRRLVLMHGGTIQVESDVGEGSVFTFTLPLFRGDEPIEAIDALSISGSFTDPVRISVLPPAASRAARRGDEPNEEAP